MFMKKVKKITVFIWFFVFLSLAFMIVGYGCCSEASFGLSLSFLTLQGWEKKQVLCNLFYTHTHTENL